MQPSTEHARRARTVRRRITNTQKEVWGEDGSRGKDARDEVEVDEYAGVLHPEKPALSRTVERTFEDEIFADESRISEADMEYWFNPDEAEGPMGSVQVKLPPVEDGDFATAQHPGKGRGPIDDVAPGTVLRGTLVEANFYHGLKFDVGLEFDVLVPVTQQQFLGPAPGKPRDAKTVEEVLAEEAVDEEAEGGAAAVVEVEEAGWPELGQVAVHMLGSDMELEVVVTGDPLRHRWPLVARIRSCEFEGFAEELDAWRGWRPQVVARADDDVGEVFRSVGREYRPSKYIVPFSQDYKHVAMQDELVAEDEQEAWSGQAEPLSTFDAQQVRLRKMLHTQRMDDRRRRRAQERA
ncbi:unnamed protein product [Pedinophyceae sp. YPF-701]|nr:unnamed protein product [Pedinophyceae sp. YPF-701]